MAILPDDPTKRRGVIAIGVSLVVLGGVYQYVYSPKTAEIGVAEERLALLEEQNRRAQLTYARGRGLEDQIALYEGHVMRLEELIPAAEEVPQLLNDITSEGRRVNVEVAAFTPEGLQPGEPYSRDSYSLTVIGEYHDIGRFLSAIASLSRIITPIELELIPYTEVARYADRGMERPLQAMLRIETYVLPEPGSGPPPADVPGGEE